MWKYTCDKTDLSKIKYLVRMYFIWNFFLFFDCREAKQHVNPKNLGEAIGDLGKLKCAKCNCNGSKVSVLCDKVSSDKTSVNIVR